MSQAQRQAANEWYDHTLYSRLHDTLTGAIVLIMHRLHGRLSFGRKAGEVLHPEREPPEMLEQIASQPPKLPPLSTLFPFSGGGEGPAATSSATNCMRNYSTFSWRKRSLQCRPAGSA